MLNESTTHYFIPAALRFWNNHFEDSVAYAPIPSPVQIDASATVGVSDALVPDQRTV